MAGWGRSRILVFLSLLLDFDYLRAIAPLPAEITAAANSSIYAARSDTAKGAAGSFACFLEAAEPQLMTFPGFDCNYRIIGEYNIVKILHKS